MPEMSMTPFGDDSLKGEKRIPSGTRRAFLKTMAAASVLLTMPLLAKRISLRQPQDFLKEALEQAKQEGKLVLAILLSQENYAWIVNDLSILLVSGDQAARRIFCEAVFVCLVGDAAAKHFPKHKPDGSVLCLSAEGEVLDERFFEGGLFGGKFVDAMSLLLHGKDGKRLCASVETQRKALGAAVCARADKALAELGSEEYRAREAASRDLLEIAPQATALLVQAWLASKDPEVRTRIGGIFDKRFAAAPVDKPGPRLPYGFVAPLRDPCPTCGMGVIRPASRIFLNMLAS